MEVPHTVAGRVEPIRSDSLAGDLAFELPKPPLLRVRCPRVFFVRAATRQPTARGFGLKRTRPETTFLPSPGLVAPGPASSRNQSAFHWIPMRVTHILHTFLRAQTVSKQKEKPPVERLERPSVQVRTPNIVISYVDNLGNAGDAISLLLSIEPG
jgi:hypothetical protein